MEMMLARGKVEPRMKAGDSTTPGVTGVWGDNSSWLLNTLTAINPRIHTKSLLLIMFGILL